MHTEVISAVLLPFLGTTLGAGLVFFLKGKMHRMLQRSLTGFAAGVMVAASIWSLIIPAMDQSHHLGKLAFLPALVGVWCTPASCRVAPSGQDAPACRGRISSGHISPVCRR